jgi:uncharacterized protein YbjT (DUF2867 family)
VTVAVPGLTVVAGSLGDQGGAAAEVLYTHACRVRALSRDLGSRAACRLRGAGLDVVQDDLEDPHALRHDLAGAGQVFGALTPFDPGGLTAELRQARNLAAAALRAGAGRLVYSSVGDPDQDRDVSPGAPWGVERLLRGCGPSLTLLRPAFFMENLGEFGLRWDDHEELVLRMPLDPRATVQFIALRDVGEFIRLALERPEAFAGPPPELAGDELTLQDALALIGEKLGAATRYERISPDEVSSEHARGMYRWFESYAHYEADIDGLRALYPELRDFRQWLDQGLLDQSKLRERPAA